MTASRFHPAGCTITDRRLRADDSTPRIAVLIPCFNAAKDLPRALRSLAANDEPHDTILVDDGSAKPLISELPEIPDNVVIIRLETNSGITAALNIGLAYIASEGYDFAARLDADDWCCNDRLRKQVRFMDTNPGVALLGTWAHTVDEAGDFLFANCPSPTIETLRRELAYRNPIVHSSLMLRVSTIVASGAYNQSFRKAEDYELIRRIDAANGLAVIPEVLAFFQVTRGSISSRRLSQVAADLRVKLLYFSPLSVHSYLGMLKTAASAFLPRRTILALRKLAGRASVARGISE